MTLVPIPVLLWFRLDLRVEDNPALAAAHATGVPIIPVYVWAPEEEGEWPPGAASRWWLHHALRALDASLRKRGSRLILTRGPAAKTLAELAAQTGAGALYFNRRVEPALAVQERKIAAALEKIGRAVHAHNSALLIELEAVRTQQGGVYHVFTPFWNAIRRLIHVDKTSSAPRVLAAPARWPASLELANLGMLPKLDWAAGMAAAWTPGEKGAHKLLQAFANAPVAHYPAERDNPGAHGTSRLSPHLHFGELGPRQIWAALEERETVSAAHGYTRGAEAYKRQLAWREFAHYMLHHHPETAGQPLRVEFAKFPWKKNARLLKAWQRGQTGYPIVDAGMRELWTTGWMHNRVRMIVASFLVKDLLQPWQAGARWFWDTLVDADLANNTMGWQWTAGCGADAAPYFRVFNPMLQGAKFDPRGEYVRKWVPELGRLANIDLNAPWKADRLTLAAPGIAPGESYPDPVVDHAQAREAALEAYATIRK